MSNRRLILVGIGVFLIIPALAILSLAIWFEMRFVQLESFADTELVQERWEIGEAINTCNFNITKEKQLVTVAHPNEIWGRTPDAWQKGENAHRITEPRTVDPLYLGFIRPVERVFVNYKEKQTRTDMFVLNTLSLKIPLPICDFIR